MALSLAAIISIGFISNEISTVNASYYNPISTYQVINDVFDKNYSMSYEELKEYGLSDSEINAFNNFSSPYNNMLDSKNPRNINFPNYNKNIQTFGKFSSAARIIRKAYNKLPRKIKNLIAKYTRINILLNLIEHYTGTLEDAIYSAFRKIGMPKGIANFVTKTIMLFVF